MCQPCQYLGRTTCNCWRKGLRFSFSVWLWSKSLFIFPFMRNCFSRPVASWGFASSLGHVIITVCLFSGTPCHSSTEFWLRWYTSLNTITSFAQLWRFCISYDLCHTVFIKLTMWRLPHKQITGQFLWPLAMQTPQTGTCLGQQPTSCTWN